MRCINVLHVKTDAIFQNATVMTVERKTDSKKAEPSGQSLSTMTTTDWTGYTPPAWIVAGTFRDASEWIGFGAQKA